MVKGRKSFGEAKKCINPTCVVIFQPTTQNKSQIYCSRSCKTQVVLGRRKRKPHSEKTKSLISKNRTGIIPNRKYKPNLKHMQKIGRISAQKRIKPRPILNCERIGCNQTFQLKRPSDKTRFCSRTCSQKTVTKIGELNKGKSTKGGRCKWYGYNSPVAGQVNVQGTWELRFVHCLDEMGKIWRTNHNQDRFVYLDLNKNQHTYSPDFWSDGVYYDVKGYIDKNTKHKLDEVRKQNIPLEIIDWNKLKTLERELFGKELCAQNISQAAFNIISNERR